MFISNASSTTPLSISSGHSTWTAPTSHSIQLFVSSHLHLLHHRHEPHRLNLKHSMPHHLFSSQATILHPQHKFCLHLTKHRTLTLQIQVLFCLQLILCQKFYFFWKLLSVYLLVFSFFHCFLFYSGCSVGLGSEESAGTWNSKNMSSAGSVHYLRFLSSETVYLFATVCNLSLCYALVFLHLLLKAHHLFYCSFLVSVGLRTLLDWETIFWWDSVEGESNLRVTDGQFVQWYPKFSLASFTPGHGPKTWNEDMQIMMSSSPKLHNTSFVTKQKHRITRHYCAELKTAKQTLTTKFTYSDFPCHSKE